MLDQRDLLSNEVIHTRNNVKTSNIILISYSNKSQVFLYIIYEFRLRESREDFPAKRMTKTPRNT